MRHETTINQLPEFQGLFTVVDHITVSETDPNTGTTEEVTLPPPLIRRTERRDGTIWWVLTPPGVHERIFVTDQAPVTVYFKDVDPGRFTGHLPPQNPAQQSPPAANWPHPAAQQPAAYPAQPPAAPQPAAAPRRPAAPWNTQPPQS
ncbi:hypothetical protein AB0B04_18775 [Streptomyces xinghaiensis]|uniref:Uncharacterized protein n=2 Tax=Streptomyces TaxID=1883 RepID=A0A420UY00_9ACTN|nr:MULTISPECIES: hypothetical protein [Streptomyces]KNE81401.1 hypothetical protein ADZ36_16615 [Streptomyces fradiae]OFA48258.1 hypothetical protein BEN35_19150 [Streptomyces fradiae]PQM20673.1 hypothetical protein Sfr7A_26165 [Streptomyces xinghaiensis]RKM92613.1 hypothetical protein SFRA_024820 [Streptomyces xinghaiensis]RNC70581.1 hypothetical protein DC095_025810 [Streptomyces xinghaiensis]